MDNLKRKFSKQTLESFLIDMLELFEGTMEERSRIVEAIDKTYTYYEQEIDTLDETTTFIK